MATEQKNVRRIQELTRTAVETNTKTKMLALANDSNPSLGFKTSSGAMVWFNSEDGDAQYRSARITNLAGTGNRNIGVDENGTLIELNIGDTPVDYTDYIPQQTAPTYSEGRLFYDDASHSMAYYNDIASATQNLGRELWMRGVNNTGDIILNGTVIDAISVSNGLPEFVKADADSYSTNTVIGVVTHDIAIGEEGEATYYGVVNDFDTSHLTQGGAVYLDTIAGALTSDRPEFPAKAVLVGGCLVSDAVNGSIITIIQEDTYQYEFDGCITEKHDTEIRVEADNKVYMYVENLGGGDLIVQLGSEVRILDCTTIKGYSGLPTETRARIELIQGTAILPQSQLVHIDLTGETPTLHTTVGYPTVPFAIVSRVSIRDYINVNLYGADADRRTNSSIQNDGRGRISYLSERWGIESAKWFSGVTPTASIIGGILLDLDIIAGIVYQTHKQSMPALTVSTDGIFVANGSGGNGLDNYSRYTNLADVCGYTNVDEVRDTNGRGHLVVFGVINKDTNDCKLYVNLPETLYGGTESSAYYDPDSTAVYTVPDELRFTAFLIAQIPYDISGGAVIDFINPAGKSEIINLLGTPVGVSGGASGGSGTFIPPLSQVLAEGNIAGAQIKSVISATEDGDALTLGSTTIDAFGDTERALTFIADGTNKFTIFGDGKMASLNAEIATLDSNDITSVAGMIGNLSSNNVNAGTPVNLDSVINIGAGVGGAESYDSISTDPTTDFTVSGYIEDTVTGELFVGYKTWKDPLSNKRLRVVASFNGGPAFSWSLTNEVTPTQYSVIHQDASNSYFQASADLADNTTGSYSGAGIYAGYQAGVTYVPAQGGDSLHVEGTSLFDDTVTIKELVINDIGADARLTLQNSTSANILFNTTDLVLIPSASAGRIQLENSQSDVYLLVGGDAMTSPAQTIASIDADVTGKALVTKEYITARDSKGDGVLNSSDGNGGWVESDLVLNDIGADAKLTLVNSTSSSILFSGTDLIFRPFAGVGKIQIQGSQGEVYLTAGLDDAMTSPAQTIAYIDADVSGKALVTKEYIDSVNLTEKQYHKSGTVSGNVVIPLFQDSLNSSGLAIFGSGSVGCTIKGISIQCGKSSSSDASNVTVRLASLPKDSAVQYSVGGGTQVLSEQLLVTGASVPTRYYKTDEVIVDADVNDQTILFAEINTNNYTLEDVTITIQYVR